jgi:hypothetical protein
MAKVFYSVRRCTGKRLYRYLTFRQKTSRPSKNWVNRANGYLGALAQMVMARLERIRISVIERRSQRSEAGNEIRVGKGMDEVLMCLTLFMVYLLGFEDEVDGFRYPPDGDLRN